MARAAPVSATAKQVRAWKERTGNSNESAALLFGVNTRTFSRWLSGQFQSPKWLGDRFREGVK